MFDESKRSVRVREPRRMIHPDDVALLDALEPRSFIIPKNHPFREYWEYVVMTLAIYNCTWTPLTISFEWAKA